MALKRRKNGSKEAKQISDGIKSKSKNKPLPIEFFNTGCVMFNLAVSGHRHKGIPRSRVTNLVGDGSSGKTLLALECAYNFLSNISSIESEIFGSNKTGKVVYNNGEGVMDFPLEKMFGDKFRKAVDWKRSKTIEAAGRDFLMETRAMKTNESLLYIIDSWDSFKSIHDTKIQEEKDEDIIKGYNLKKQQFAWAFFQEVCDLLENNKSDATLIVISQTKQKIGVTFGKKKYRTGGDALNFYTHLVPWLRTVKEMKKQKGGEQRTFGIESEFKIERSKVGMCFRQVPFIHLYNYGVDDIGSMALYLKARKKTNFKDIKLSGSIHEFAKAIEQKGLKQRLARYVEQLWVEVEEKFEEEIMERTKKELK